MPLKSLISFFTLSLILCLTACSEYRPMTEARISSTFTAEERAAIIDGIEDLCAVADEACLPWRVVDSGANILPLQEGATNDNPGRNTQAMYSNTVYVGQLDPHVMGLTTRHLIMRALRLDAEYQEFSWSLVPDPAVFTDDYYEITPLCVPEGDARWLCEKLECATYQGTCPLVSDRSLQDLPDYGQPLISEGFSEEQGAIIKRAIADWASVGATVNVWHFQIVPVEQLPDLLGWHSSGVVGIRADALDMLYEIALHEIGHNVKACAGIRPSADVFCDAENEDPAAHHSGVGVMNYRYDLIEHCISAEDLAFVGLSGKGTCE